MKNRISGTGYAFLVVAAIGLFLLITATDFPIKSKILPYMFGPTLIFLAAIGFINDTFRKPRKAPAQAEPGEAKEKVNLKPHLIAVGWLVGFVFAVWLIGLTASIAILILAFSKVYGARWISAIFASAVTTVICYYVFQVLLMVTLYQGLIPSLIWP